MFYVLQNAGLEFRVSSLILSRSTYIPVGFLCTYIPVGFLRIFLLCLCLQFLKKEMCVFGRYPTYSYAIFDLDFTNKYYSAVLLQ